MLSRSVALAFAAVAVVAIAGPTWKLVDSDIATTATGVAFTSDTTGYASAGSNGAGPQIFKSTNGGAHWTACQATFGLDMLLLDLDAADETVVVSSIFGELYSDDSGNSFKQSVGGGTSQSVRFLGTNGDGGKKFGVTGQYGSAQGVGISVDGGATFKAFNAGLSTQARYGAFPTDTTWYVAAGDWPQSNNDDDPKTDDDNGMDDEPPVRAMRSPKSAAMKANGHFPAKFDAKPKPPTGSYQAQIVKTTDGGNSFKTLFNVTNEFYFNAIDCQPSNPDWCCAVGEAFQDSPAPGARIHCTQDGGASWNRTFWAPMTSTSGYSLMEIAYATNNDVWAVGGELNAIDSSAWFLYSADGGLTWSHGTPPMSGYMAMGLSFVDPTHAWAALDNTITQEAAIAEYA